MYEDEFELTFQVPEEESAPEPLAAPAAKPAAPVEPVVEKGLREAEAQRLLQAFFASLREKRAGRPRWKPPVPENREK